MTVKRKRIPKQESKVSGGETETHDKSYGVVLIAIGNTYYAKAAVNMVISIKSYAKDINVTLVTQGDILNHIEPDEVALFDNIIKAPDNYTNGIRGYDVFKCKLHLDELTPYDQTLYIDVDAIWNNDHSIHEFIKSFDGIGFTCGNRGRISTTDKVLRSKWMDLNKIQFMYKIDQVYDLSSEVMYFEKGTKVFEAARDVYEDLRIEVNSFGAGFPDEVFIMVAIELVRTRLRYSPFYPTYWQPHYFYDRIQAKKESEIRQFKILSLGGAFTANNVKRLYENMAGASYFQAGINKTPYQLRNKSGEIKERRQI